MFLHYTGMMPDVNPAYKYGLVQEIHVPDANRDAINAYLQKVCAAGIAQRCMRDLGTYCHFNNNELVNHALGYAIYQRLPEDIRKAIAQLRAGESKPVLVLRNLVVTPSMVGYSFEKSDYPTVLLLKGIGAMLGADYAGEIIQGGYYAMSAEKVFHRGDNEYHIDGFTHLSLEDTGEGRVEAKTDIPFSSLLCQANVPEVPTVFVPLSQKNRWHEPTVDYMDDPGDRVLLQAGDLVIFNNREVLHARHDPKPDQQQRLLIGGFFTGKDNSANFYPGNYNEPAGKEGPHDTRSDKDIVARFADTLAGEGSAERYQQMLQEARIARLRQEGALISRK